MAAFLMPLVCLHSSNYSWAQADGAQQQKPMILDTLEIKDMDINDVLKLLAAKSGLNIIAGKSIVGRVTIFLQNVEVHDALTIILKANDLAYMEGHGVVQIMTGAEYEQITGHKFGVNTQSTIVSLQSAKASDVVAVLNQVKSQTGKVIADDQSNSIIIEDVPEKMAQLLDFIKTMDAPTQLTVYTLQHIAGESLVAKLQELSSPKIGSVKFDTLSNKLFIKDTPKKVKEIMAYIDQVDVPRITQVFSINYAKADDLVKTIGPMLTKDVGSVEFDPRSNSLMVMDIQPKIDEIGAMIDALDKDPRLTKVFNINYAKADDLAKTIGPMLTKDVGSIEFDTRSNTLVVMDIPPKVDEIGKMIGALDHKDKEVYIDAKIVQITLNNDYQMGVDWQKLIIKSGNTNVKLGSIFPIPGGITSGLGTASIGTLSDGTFNNVIQALDTFGKSRTLSSPRLAVINNQEASILIGSNTPYTTSTTTSTTTSPVTAESVSFVDTGVKLHVTPTIHDDGFISMKIKPEISDISSFFIDNSNGGNKIPIVDTDEVQTNVRVKDGVTIIIGGLMKDVRSNTKNKVPVLGDLPIIGKAFSNEDRSMQKTEIIIFLTPHIINGDVREDPNKYLKSTPSLKAVKTYYDPLPEDESTIPVE